MIDFNKYHGVEWVFFDRILCKTINVSLENMRNGEVAMNDFGGSELQIIFPFNPYYQEDRNIFPIITY